MNKLLASEHSQFDEISNFLEALRLAARARGPFVVSPTQVGKQLSDEIYSRLSELEARLFRAPYLILDRPNLATDSSTIHLGQFQAETSRRANEYSCPPSVEEIMSNWLEFHVAGLAAPDRYRYSVAHLNAFFKDQRQLGRLGARTSVNDLTPELQARFRAWRTAAGVGGHTISRDLAALRGSLGWAWKHQLIAQPPFIANVPIHLRGSPRDRVLSLAEIARIIAACVGRPDREHLIRFIVIELGTAGRPQAVLELTDGNIDLDRNLIDPNQPGRTHARKRRAIVPIARAVRPWLVGVRGKIIKYRVPITRRKLGQGGVFFERETRSIKRCWKKACLEANVSGATPKTLRHTMLTWLAERGVPSEQRQMLAGHSARGTTARNYEHLSPSYLKTAIEEVDAYFVELGKHTSAISRPPPLPAERGERG